MSLLNLISVALTALWANKSRSVLTMLGVIIGVAAVSMLVAIGNGLQVLVQQQFDDFGVNNVFVAPGELISEDGGFGGEDQATALAGQNLDYRDVQTIRRLRETVDQVTGLSLRPTTVEYRGENKRTSVTGVDAEFFSITNTTPEIGRSFTPAENERRARVAFLGHDVAKEVFGEEDPVGKTIRVSGQKFRVIGVSIPKGGGFGGPSFDSYVYVPIRSWHRMFNEEGVFRIIAQANSEADIEPAKEAIKIALNERYKDDEFSVFEQTEILDIINQILGGLTAGLGGIAAISLLVGGIGIMNIMLVSVTERTREIGLRKAVGATPKVILIQFLLEAIVLSFMGGLIGVLLAFLGTLAIQAFIPAVLTPFAVSLAFGVSVAVGVIFGVYPAQKAARLSPIDALRYE